MLFGPIKEYFFYNAVLKAFFMTRHEKQALNLLPSKFFQEVRDGIHSCVDILSINSLIAQINTNCANCYSRSNEWEKVVTYASRVTLHTDN